MPAAMGDVVLFGDPSLVINAPNQGAFFGQVSGLAVPSDAGEVLATWCRVSGADGYTVSLGTAAGLPMSLIHVPSNTTRFHHAPIGTLVHGERYFVSVRPYKELSFHGKKLRTYARLPAVEKPLVLDRHVNPPEMLVASREGGKIMVRYRGSPDRDILRYDLFRAETGGGSETRITSFTDQRGAYEDKTAKSYRDYVYTLVAVDKTQNASEAVVATVGRTVVMPHLKPRKQRF